jgi:opacity protein-like surface antigen
MKKSYALAGIMILAAVLLVLPVGAKAEMYVEAYIGGVQAASETLNPAIARPEATEIAKFSFSGNFDPAVVGGLKVGTWFVKEGFLGYNYPDWMKYFGFYLDFSYHRLDLRKQSGRLNDVVGGVSIANVEADLFSEGYAATLAFMFAARYGFLPDSEVPFGRLQPYIGVGPAVMFTGQQPYIRVPISGYQANGSSQSTAVIALAVDAGVRWMALKNVSIDLCFNYRFAQPSFDFNYVDPFSFLEHRFTLDPTLHIFGGKLGAAYHF